jgi:hypothetical protein
MTWAAPGHVGAAPALEKTSSSEVQVAPLTAPQVHAAQSRVSSKAAV